MNKLQTFLVVFVAIELDTNLRTIPVCPNGSIFAI